MNKLTSTALVDQHRRRWHWQGSDVAIARRAERTYLALAVVNAGMAGVFALLFQAAGLMGKVALPMACLITGALYFWQSRRFTKIRRHLSEAEAKTAAL